MSTRNPLLVEVTDRIGPKLNAELIRRLRHDGHPAITPAHARVFEHLADGARLTELAERAQITKQSMGELIGGLERLGYVQRERDSLDRRAQVIRATGRGEAVMRRARKDIAAVYRAAQDKLGERRVAELEQLLLEYEQVLDEWCRRDRSSAPR